MDNILDDISIEDLKKTTAEERVEHLEEDLEQTDTEYEILFDRMSKLRGTQFGQKNKILNKQVDSNNKQDNISNKQKEPRGPPTRGVESGDSTCRRDKLNHLEEQLKQDVAHCKLVSDRMSRLMTNLRELEDELESVSSEYKTLYDNIKKLNCEYRATSVERDFNTYL